jgi:hypothetical protein
VSLRDCFKLQRITPFMCPQETMFGRALVDTERRGPGGLDAPDRYYRLYWLKLPIWQYRRDYRRVDSYSMQQAVLFLHGRDGFMVIWWDAK